MPRDELIFRPKLHRLRSIPSRLRQRRPVIIIVIIVESEIELSERPCQNHHHLRIRHAPPRTSPRAPTERAERALRARDTPLSLPGVDDPALGSEPEWVREVAFLAMEGVGRRSDVDAGREVRAVNVDAAGQDLAREDAAKGRGEAQRFVDAGAQVGAGCEGGADADVVCIVFVVVGGKVAVDFGPEFGEAGRRVEEVEEGGAHGCGEGVGPYGFTMCWPLAFPLLRSSE